MPQNADTGLTESDTGDCLNCGEALHGAFCAACGQRSVPANPTVSELAGDAWQELSGYDGRIASTIRGLLQPGQLTRDYLRGQRARYLPPVRVYLIVSVVYFVVAAAAPNLSTQSSAELIGPDGVRIGLTRGGLSESDRAAVRAELETAPWYVRPMLQSVLDDPAAFRARMMTIMPRVFFALLPVFAAIVSLFYRGRTFPTFLVFAVHVHAFAFLLFTLSEASKFTGVVWFAIGVGILAAVVFAIYTLRAFRAVFGDSWPQTIVKASVIGIVYLFVALPANVVILLWASLV
jgi:hypothetical protein